MIYIATRLESAMSKWEYESLKKEGITKKCWMIERITQHPISFKIVVIKEFYL